MKGKKKALGRGLSAILESPDTDITSRDISGNYVVGAIANIRLDQIEMNPFQPRTSLNEESLKELSFSIKARGVIQPVTVRKLGYDKYQLISGERRVKAARLAGMEEIPAYIRVADDEQMLEMALIENIQRDDLNPLQIAFAYQRLIDECNITQEQLGNSVGKNRTTVTNYLRLLKLPPEIQVALRDDRITMGHARALINIDDTESQLYLLRIIIEKELSVREVEKIVRNLDQQPVKKRVAKQPVLPEHIFQLQTKLAEKFQRKVEIKRNTKGKGTVVIPFVSDEELEQIITILE